MSRFRARSGGLFSAALLLCGGLFVANAAAALDGTLDPTFSTDGWTVSAPASLEGPFPVTMGVSPGGRCYSLAQRIELDGKPSLYRVTFTDVPSGVTGVDHEFLGFPGPGQPPPPEAISAAGSAPGFVADGWYYLFSIRRTGEPAYLAIGVENFEAPGAFSYNDNLEPVAASGATQEPVGLATVREDEAGTLATRAVAAVNEQSGPSQWAVLRRFGADVGTVPTPRLWPNGAPYVAFAGARTNGVVADPQGRLVVFGSLDELAWIARLLPNGDLDTTFDGDGQKALPLAAAAGSDRYAIRRLKVDENGTIFLLGTRTDGDGFGNMVLGKLDDTGQPVTSFGASGFLGRPEGDLLAGLAIQTDGKVLVAGQRGSSTRPGIPQPDLVGTLLLQRFLPNGSFDSTFGSGGETEIDFGRLSPPQDGAIDVDIQGGRPVVYGFSSDENGPALLFARFQSNLIFAHSFDAGTLLGWSNP